MKKILVQLSMGIGYGVILGFAYSILHHVFQSDAVTAFSLCMFGISIISFILSKLKNETQDFETFRTASVRSIWFGLSQAILVFSFQFNSLEKSLIISASTYTFISGFENNKTRNHLPFVASFVVLAFYMNEWRSLLLPVLSGCFTALSWLLVKRTSDKPSHLFFISISCLFISIISMLLSFYKGISKFELTFASAVWMLLLMLLSLAAQKIQLTLIGKQMASNLFALSQSRIFVALSAAYLFGSNNDTVETVVLVLYSSTMIISVLNNKLARN